MIQNVIPVISDELNQFLKSRFQTLEDKVVLSGLNFSGGTPPEITNKIVCTLIGIEEESTLKSSGGASERGGGFFASAGPIRVNLKVLFSAHFDSLNYTEALKFISGVIYFFQSKRVFTEQNTPGLEQTGKQISFELQNTSLNELNFVFSMLGTQHVPCVLYKVRMLTFDSNDMVTDLPSVSGIDLNN